MKKLSVFVAGIKARFFPSEDDCTWKEWVDFKPRETRDLVELLSRKVRDGFKRRALYLLCVPSDDFNPIYWTEEVGKFYHRGDFLNGLPAALLEYVADLMVEFHTAIMPQHCDRPRQVVEGGGSITLFMSVPDRYHTALCYYNSWIIEMLYLLPAEKAEKLFGLFSLRDISTYASMDDASGYNPFARLINHPQIDERWKREADAKMRRIIQDELEGRESPREDWEDALRQYSDIVQTTLYGELRYPLDMFISQVQFIVDHSQGQKRLFGNHVLDRLFNILSGEEHVELRRAIARYCVLESDGFHAFSDSGQQVADQMLEDSPDDDELVAEIHRIKEEGAQRLSESRARATSQKEAEQGILGRMS